MASALSVDLRKRVIRAIEAGLSRRQAAAKFDISIASAIRWYERYLHTGFISARSMGGDRRSSRAERHAQKILDWIDETPDITIPEICARLSSQGHSFATSTIWRLLEHHPTGVNRGSIR